MLRLHSSAFLALVPFVFCALFLLSAPPVLGEAKAQGFELRRISSGPGHEGVAQRSELNDKRLVPGAATQNITDLAGHGLSKPTTNLLSGFGPGTPSTDLFSPSQLARIAAQSIKVHQRYGNTSDPGAQAKLEHLSKTLQYAVDLIRDDVMNVVKQMGSGSPLPATSSEKRAEAEKDTKKDTKERTDKKSKKTGTPTHAGAGHQHGHPDKTGTHHHHHHSGHHSAKKSHHKSVAHKKDAAKTGLHKPHKQLGSKMGSSLAATTKGVVNVPLEVELNADGYQLEPNAWFTIGGDRYLMTIDSGSTTPWLKGTKFPGKKGKAVTHPTTGKGGKPKGFSLQYGIGNVQGHFHTVSELGLGDLKIKDLQVGAADTISKNFKEDKADGVMGLAFRELNRHLDSGASFLERLYASNSDLDKKIVCLAMQNDANKSSMQFGGPERSLYKGDLAWAPINKLGFWQLNIDSFAASPPAAAAARRDSTTASHKDKDKKGAKGKSSGKSGITNMDLILDSGTSLIVAGPEGAKAFWADVPDSTFHHEYDLYTFPCNANLKAELKLGGKTWMLEQQHLSLGPMKAGSDRCIGSVGGMDTQGVIVWGLAGLRSMYACMDHDKKTIGIGQPTW